MIHSDGAVLGDYVKKFFASLPNQNKQLLWTEGTAVRLLRQP